MTPTTGVGKVEGLLLFLGVVSFFVGWVWLIAVKWKKSCRWLWHISGCCVCCGYDLRETPDRCPECGATYVERRDRMRELWRGI